MAGIISLLAGCSSKQQSGFQIIGTVDNLPDSTKLFLQYRLNGQTVIDTAYVVNKQFIFSDTIEDTFRATIYRGESRNIDYVRLYIVKGITRLNAADSLKYAVILNSAVNDEETAWKEAIKDVTDGETAMYDLYYGADEETQESEEFQQMIEQMNDSLNDIKLARAKEFIQANPGAFVGLDQLFQTIVGYYPDGNEAEEIFMMFSPELRETKKGKETAKSIAQWKQTSVGAVAPEFTQNDPEGNPVNLSDFRGKYVLIDFWASWCGPCRHENPNVVKAYNRFKNKGFTVLGVSLDRPDDKDKWLQAIANDHLTWTHVSDLQYWNNAAAKLYGVNAIPANFLLDPEGVIIGKNLRGEALVNKLLETL